MSEQPLSASEPLVAAVRAIEASRKRIAVVTDEAGRLLGTLTDGDVRRCLLGGGTLETPIAKAMNARPLTAVEGSSEQELLQVMRTGNVLAVPIVDASGRLVRLVHLRDIAPVHAASHDASGFDFAVIMAGGEGARLRPITQNIPKPMVSIGGVPLLERQVVRLAEANVRRIYIAINYLGHLIEEHIGDGRRLGVEVRYLQEREKLGTAGALSLLPEQPRRPVIVMNGDILTTTDFASLHAFHMAQGARITVAAIDHCVDIPYGVLQARGPFVTELIEKPSQRFLCNAGIYAVSPEALALLPARQACNMTDLVSSCLAARLPVAVFPMHEYWSDIGTPDDLAKAQAFFARQQQAHE